MRLRTIAIFLSLALNATGSNAAEPDDPTSLFASAHAHFNKGTFLKSQGVPRGKLAPNYNISPNLGNVELKLGRFVEMEKHLTFAAQHLPATMNEDIRKMYNERIAEKLSESKEPPGRVGNYR